MSIDQQYAYPRNTNTQTHFLGGREKMSVTKQQEKVLKLMAENGDPGGWSREYLMRALGLTTLGDFKAVMRPLCEPQPAKVPGIALPVLTVAPLRYIEGHLDDEYALNADPESVWLFAEKLDK